MSKLRNLLILLIFISVSSCKQKETEKSTPVSTKEKTEKVEIKETRPHITLKLKCTKGYDIAF
ncbi:MAG: hypothetical protein DSY82_05855 [Flavobacteriia bacterium]|nr:MAG: hypothetical protein DSY82_05855 [Flavobacteriia bacterium]